MSAWLGDHAMGAQVMYGVIKMRLIISTGGRGSRPRPWVARITGTDDHFGFAREFMRPVYDYTYASRKGKNTWVYYFLPPGIYETKYPISWKHDERFFFRIDNDGSRHRIAREEVIECLENVNSESMS